MPSSLSMRRAIVVGAAVFALLGGVRAVGAVEPPPGPSPSPSPTASNGLAWRNIGPSVAGGRVSTLTGTDLDPELFYAGTAGGGVWKSSNGAIDWEPVFDATGAASIGAIAISPRDKNDVWVGTGEAWPRNDVIVGDGIYRSTDGGLTWKHRGLEGTSQIARVAIDPRNPEHVLVAALGSPFTDSDERGVFRSDDGGTTWQKTLFLGRDSGASDIALDPTDPDVVYAGMWQFRRNAWHLTSGGEADGLYKSLDGGRTWHPLTGMGLPAGPLGRIGLAVAPSDSKRVYALIESAAGILWRSDDAGAHWALVSTNTLIDERPFYYSRIVVDPHDENHLFAVSVHLAESFDGGKAWHVAGKRTHGDHHDVWIAHHGQLAIDGNDGGIALSRDGGRSWDWRTPIAIGQVYHLGYDRRRPYDVCAGLQDNGTWCGPNDTGDDAGILSRDWTRIAGGDGTWTWPDPQDDDAVWTSLGGGDNGGTLRRYSYAAGAARDVSPYLRDQNVVPPRDLRYRFNWEAPLAYSPLERNAMYFGGNVVFRTTDRGASWRAISPDLTRNLRERQNLSGTPLRRDVTGAETFDTILSIAPSPLARGLLWVGTDDGNVALTRDGGATWVNLPVPGLDADARVVCVEASHAVAGRAYLAVERHFTGDMRPYLYVTDDYGANWRALTNDLDPGEYLHVVREDPGNPNVLFVGTERGVRWSEDRGASWTPFPVRLPPAAVRDLLFQPDAGDLIAGTHGRGIWIFDDVRALESRGPISSNNFLVAPRAATIVSRETPTTRTRAAGTNPAGPALITFYQRTPAGATPSIDILDAAGHVVRRLRAQNDDPDHPGISNLAGFNRVAWDLTGEPPTPWLRAPKWNRGPQNGAPLLAGTYRVVLHRDGVDEHATIRVEADRRNVPTVQDEVRRSTFLSALYGALSGIDEALNVLDNLRLQLPARANAGGADTVLANRLQALTVQASDLERTLTSQPANSQDDDFLTDMLRERILTLIDTVGLAPPTAEQSREATSLVSQTSAGLGRYREFTSGEIAALQRELARSGATLDLTAKPPPEPPAGPDVDERGARRDDD